MRMIELHGDRYVCTRARQCEFLIRECNLCYIDCLPDCKTPRRNVWTFKLDQKLIDCLNLYAEMRNSETRYMLGPQFARTNY